jgi:hypothetical protein
MNMFQINKQDVINQILLQKLQRNVVANENQYKILLQKPRNVRNK